jgi:hypothetical protein
VTASAETVVCRHCREPITYIPGGWLDPDDYDFCQDTGTPHEPAADEPATNPADLGPLVRQILDTIRQHTSIDGDVQAAQQLVYSGAIGTRSRAMAVQILVDRHVNRVTAEKIVDEITNTKEIRNA